jgi:DNA repair photolyase
VGTRARDGVFWREMFMPLNKSKGNMYPFVTHTWNAVKGECPHGCSYCYMKRWGKQPERHLDERELKTDLGSGNFIFVGSSCDMFHNKFFGEFSWTSYTIRHTCKFDNEYLFQTKDTLSLCNSLRIIKFPQKFIAAVTLETNRIIPRLSYAPPRWERAEYFTNHYFGKVRRMISIEPIIDFDLTPFVEMIDNCYPEMVSIGAVTSGWILPEPPKEKILELIAELETFTKVIQKKNLRRLVA